VSVRETAVLGNSRSIVKEALIAERLEHFLKTGRQVYAVCWSFDGSIHFLEIYNGKHLLDGFKGPFEDTHLETLYVDFDKIHSVKLQIIDSQALDPLPGNEAARLVIRFHPIRWTGHASAEKSGGI
jgi:hypothetical protein